MFALDARLVAANEVANELPVHAFGVASVALVDRPPQASKRRGVDATRRLGAKRLVALGVAHGRWEHVGGHAPEGECEFGVRWRQRRGGQRGLSIRPATREVQQ